MTFRKTQHRAFAVALAVLAAVVGGISVAPLAAMAATTPGRFSATYIDPYRVFDAGTARLDAMFAAQAKVGIRTGIVQWTGWIYDDGSVSTTYPAGSATGFGAFDTVLPRILDAAKRHGISIWLGLGLRPNVFDEDATKASSAVFAHDAAVDIRLADDLLAKYRGRFVGWYLPSEPGYQSVASSSVQRTETRFLRAVTTALAKRAVRLPTMISPSVPRAIEGGLSGTEFIKRLAPMIRGAGVDVWNLQDGYAMTGWSPSENLAMLRAGKDVARSAGASVWATLYTPGPGDPGTTSADGLFADLDTIRAAGVPITTWTFDSAFNPDAGRASSSSRAALYAAYEQHIGTAG